MVRLLLLSLSLPLKTEICFEIAGVTGAFMKASWTVRGLCFVFVCVLAMTGGVTSGYADGTTVPSAIVTLSSSSNPSLNGQPVTLNAEVTITDGRTPAGSVEFREGNVLLGILSLTGGTAMLTKPMHAGSHLLSAVYYGSSGFNDASCVLTQVVSQFSTPAPVITEMPADATFSCPDFLAPANDASVKATGGCGGAVTISHSPDVIEKGKFSNIVTLTRIYTATDACGHSSSRAQKIKISDMEGPVFGKIPAGMVVHADEVPTAPTVEAVDNCDSNPEVVFNETRTRGVGAGSYILTRTWTATDSSGNKSTATQKITVFPSRTQASVGGVKQRQASVFIGSR
jgi:hypothetical protein